MKKMNVAVLAFMGFATNAFAFEVNTHQAITRCAISKECKQAGAVNLHNFAKDAHLEKIDYSNQIFGNYGRTYKNYAQNGEGFTNWHITIPDGSYAKMVEAGVVLEDSVYPHRVSKGPVKGGEGRFKF